MRQTKETFGIPGGRPRSFESLTLEGLDTLWKAWEAQSKIHRAFRDCR